jgi:hypothetical protein
MYIPPAPLALEQPRLILGRLHLGVGLLDVLDPLSRHLRGQDARDARFARDDGLDDFEDLVAVSFIKVAEGVESQGRGRREVEIRRRFWREIEVGRSDEVPKGRVETRGSRIRTRRHQYQRLYKEERQAYQRRISLRFQNKHHETRMS